MALYETLPVYKDDRTLPPIGGSSTTVLEEREPRKRVGGDCLILLIYELTKHFPREYKYTLRQDYATGHFISKRIEKPAPVRARRERIFKPILIRALSLPIPNGLSNLRLLLGKCPVIWGKI